VAFEETRRQVIDFSAWLQRRKDDQAEGVTLTTALCADGDHVRCRPVLVDGTPICDCSCHAHPAVSPSQPS